MVKLVIQIDLFVLQNLAVKCNTKSSYGGTMKNQEIKEVEIPACEQHQGIHKIKVKLNWSCPICGKPRGPIKQVRSWDGSLWMICDGWDNPCGHVDRYVNVIGEAIANGLNE